MRDCVNCSHRFAAVSADKTHVAEIYGEPYFSGGAGYSDYAAEAEMLRKRRQMYANILKKAAENLFKNILKPESIDFNCFI